MEIGFIGLGKMGFPMARRLIEAKHQLTVFDTRKEVVDQLVKLGALHQQLQILSDLTDAGAQLTAINDSGEFALRSLPIGDDDQKVLILSEEQAIEFRRTGQ